MIFNRLDTTTGTPLEAGLIVLPYTFFTYAAGFTAGPSVRELHFLPRVLNLVIDYPSILVFFVVFTPIVLLGIRRLTWDPLASAVLVPWIFGLPVLVFLVGLLSNVNYQVRYTLASLPAFFVVLALGTASLKLQAVRWGAIGAVLLCSVYSVANFYMNPRYDKEDVRAAVAHIKATKLDEHQIIFVGQIAWAVQHYGANLKTVELDWEICDSEIGQPDFLQTARISDSKNIWVIVGRDWNRCAAAYLEQLSSRYRVVDHRHFAGVELCQLELHDP